MPRLVVLSEGMTGRTHELKAQKTTIGRVEDNDFQIPDASVSSHHCEIYLRGNEVTVRDLNSTNGSFINGQQFSESVLKPSQILRLGQVEVRLESDVAPGTRPKQMLDHTQIVPQGIKKEELDSTARAPSTTAPGFEKKSNTGKIAFAIGAALIAIGVVVWLAVVLFGS